MENIESVEKIIDFWLLNSKKDNDCLKALSEFNSNIDSFIISLGNSGLLREGYEETKTEIERVFNIIAKESLENRQMIGRHTVHEIKKRFLMGLSKIYKYLRQIFNPKNIGTARLDRSQLANFIFNEDFGFGKIFQFNKIGKHSAYNKIRNILDTQELLTTIRLLSTKTNQERLINKWNDLGERGTIVRILGVSNQIYFIYRISEHREYKKQLRVSPRQVVFRAA